MRHGPLEIQPVNALRVDPPIQKGFERIFFSLCRSLCR